MAHGLRRLPAAAGGVHRLRSKDDGRRAGLGGLRRPRGAPAGIRRQLQPPHRALPRPIPILNPRADAGAATDPAYVEPPRLADTYPPSTTLIGGSAGYLERCTGILRLRSGCRTRPGALSVVEARREPYVTSGPSR